MSKSGRYLFRALTVGWMMLIYILSSQPSLPMSELFTGEDLLAHVAFYAVLGVFMARSLTPPRVTAWNRILLLTILVAVYGVLDEYHQSFVPGRDVSAWDILADGLGGFLAALMLFWRDRKTVNSSQPVALDKEKHVPRVEAHPLPMDEDRR